MVVTVFLLDKNFTIQGVLDNKISWSYDRAINKATSIQVSIPRDDLRDTSKSSLLSLSQYIQIYCDGIYTIGGRITKRDYTDSTVDITAFTEEIKMESVICPAQYSRKYDGWDIADIVRDLSKGWHTQRIKSTSQWEEAVDSSNVDFNTLSNRIMLTKDGAGVYNQDGHATYRFFSSDNSSFTSWDRIRWVSDNYGQTDDGEIELVNTTIQYRYGATVGSLGSWSTPVVGAMPDTLGLDISLLNAPVLEVRINLHTDDITSEDQNGDAIGSSPVVFALEVISRTTAYIGTSNIPASTGVQADGLIADEDSAFSILSSVCEIADWEFEVYNNDIYLANRLGNDLTESFVFKRDENIKITQLSDTDDELANIIHANGKGDGINKLTVTLANTESIDAFGEYPIVKSFDTEDLTELTSLAQAYIDEHSFPVFDWRVDTFDSIDSTITSNITPEGALAFHRLYSNSTFSTPSHNLIEQNLFFYKPVYMAGDTIRIIDPRTGTIIDSRILEEKRQGDLNGIKVSLYLNKPRTSLVGRVPKPVEPFTIGTPASISVKPMLGGVIVTVAAPAERYKWSDTELYMSEESPVLMETPIKVARATSFAISGLHSDKRYYFTARYIEFSGRVSQASDEVSCIPGSIGVDDIEVITAFGMKMNSPSNGHVTLCGSGIDNVLQDADGVIHAPAGGELLTVPNMSIDCTASVFKSIGTDMDAWTYLVMSGGTVFPVYYSLADALFYNASNDEISTGVVIGRVKVGVVSSEDDSARILDTVAYTVAMELSTVAREQTQYAFKYLSQSTSPTEFEQYARNLGITDFFTTLAVWDLFAERIKVNQLQIGSGTTSEGFVFYAIDNQETGEKIIQVWSDGIKIFEINPITKNISIGDYENENGLRWVHEDREMIFKGTGNFNGEINHDALKTRPEDNSGTTVPIPAKSRYIGSDVYNAFSSVSTSGWTNVTGTFNATAIASATRLPTDSTLRQVWYATFDSDYSFTSPITARVKITFNCISTFLNATTTRVYVNGVLYSSLNCNGWGQSSTTSFFVNVTKGQTILVDSSGQNRTQYVKMEVYGKGTILQKSSTDMEFINYYGYYGTQLNTSSPNAFDYSANLNYASGQQFLNNASTLTTNKIYNTDTANSTLTVVTTPRTISGVLKLTSEMRIYFDNGDIYTIVGNTAEGATTGWYPISGSFKLLVATAAIQTKFVEPQANATYDLGYKDDVDSANDKRYANLYLSNNIEGDESGTISGFNIIAGSISVTGSLNPRSNPTTGSQSISAGSYYTPLRGLYNSSMNQSNRGSGFGYALYEYESSIDSDSVVFGGDGPYAGTSATRVYNQSSGLSGLTITWYYAKF